MDDKYNELKMDYDDEKQRADEMDAKVRLPKKEFSIIKLVRKV